MLVYCPPPDLNGPFAITYVNPANDPSKARKT